MKQFLIAGTALLALSACNATESNVDPDAQPEAVEAVQETMTKDTMATDMPIPSNAITTDSGLKYIVAQAGLENGATAAPGQQIAAHYHGFFPNGEVFDSSYERGRPLVGPSNGFIKGWNEALGEMKVCEARTLYITPDLGYGDADRGPIPGGSTLYFHMQLLAVDAPATDEIATECPEDKVLKTTDAYN